MNPLLDINRRFNDAIDCNEGIELKQSQRLEDIKERYSHHTVKELIECLHLDNEAIDEIHSKIIEDFQYYVEHPTKWESDHGNFDKYYKILKAYIIEEYA